MTAQDPPLRGTLTAQLSLPAAFGMSLALISPTVTAAFNITLVVQAAGPAAPLTFAIGAMAMALVALSFMSFAQRVAHAGSAYAYISHTFGSRMGFVAGWTLLLTYLGFTTGFAALVGSFTCAALSGLGLNAAPWWIAIGAVSTLLAWWLAYRDMRLAGRLMLMFEAAAVAGVIVLCICILRSVHPGIDVALDSVRPSASFGGWTGLGFGMVFSILCFAGFEGAATLGEETLHPRRDIPIALFGTVTGSGVFFIFVAYCEVMGFTPAGIHDLANSTAPLNDLALRYTSRELAIALDLAAAVSCFSGILGGIAATARVLFALGRAGLSPALAGVHKVHGTPATSISLAAILILVPFLLWAPYAGASNYYSYTSTIGVLALILIYVAIGGAEMVESWSEQRRWWAATCMAGPILLLWVLFRSLYPIPESPNNWWPYVALAWVAASGVIIKLRPAVSTAPVQDFSS